MRQNVPLTAFNRGIISPLALARVDVQRVALSAEEQANWMPKKLGPMSLRPGLEYVGSTRNDAKAHYLPFVFAVDDTALVELTPGIARFWVDDALVTFPSVSTAITNDLFTTNITGWTDADEAGCISVWSSGAMSLTGDGTNQAIRYQLVPVAALDHGVLHAVSVKVASGDCVVRIGSTVGGQEYVSDTACKPGATTLAFTPSGDFYVQVMNSDAYPGLVDSITIYTGILEVATPWTTEENLQNIRVDQSGDVLFVACDGVRQQRIERRSNNGWGVVDYVTYDGPFLTINVTPTTLTPSALVGPATITASRPVFKQQHVGALFSMTTQGQQVSANLSAENTFTNTIRVFGAGASRASTIVISGTWVGTLTLQRSLGEPGLWEDTAATYAANTTTSFNDGLDNQIVYYRLGFKTGNYTSGTAVISITYANGTTTGAFRITGYTTPTVVTGNIVRQLGSLTPTVEWAEGAWSNYRGFPSAVSLHEGRLGWFGKSTEWLSVTDSFHSFDIDFEGDAGPIIRSIGSGPVDKIKWAVSTSRLILGGGGAEHSVRSSSLDEPITPTNFNIKAYTSRGSSSVDAVKVDQSVMFVDRSGHRVYALSPDQGGNHSATEATVMCPAVAKPSIVRMGAQRNPDTRLHCVRSDGKVAVLVYDQAEDVNAWMIVETDGVIEDVVTLPAAQQDETYYVVQRTINGAPVRYLEKWAHDDDCVGGLVNKQADAYKQITNFAPAATLTGLAHLKGESVVCWADGKDLGIFIVSTAGEITLPSPVTQAIVGLTYRARFKSVKLAHAAQGGTALTQTKRVDHLALILANTHYQGLRYGRDFDTLDDLPLVEDGAVTSADTVWEAYDAESIEFNGTYGTDERLCLEAQAPRPCTVLGAIISIKTNDKL
jgi:hypothetical protein